jgi:hypothetical protein
MKSRPRPGPQGLIWIAFTVTALLSRELYGGWRHPAKGPIGRATAMAVGRDRPCADAEGRDRRIRAKVGDWALVWGPWEAGGWADVLESPNRDANRIAQALLGDRVEVLGQFGDWMEVSELERSWRGWIQAEHLTYGSSRVRRTFATKPTVALATSPYLAIDGCGSRAPYGAQLPVADGSKTRFEVQLPDGRRLDVERSQVALTDQPESISFALEHVEGLLRRPFQTGGNSPAAVDGVGLVYLLLRASGYGGVPREPAALWERATPVSNGAMEPGDVLLLDTFGGQPPSPAILVTDRILLEASPASGVNFLPLDESTRSRLREVRRFSGSSSDGGGARPALTLRAAPAHEWDLLLLFIVLISQNAALIALLLVACHREIGNGCSGEVTLVADCLRSETPVVGAAIDSGRLHQP